MATLTEKLQIKVSADSRRFSAEMNRVVKVVKNAGRRMENSFQRLQGPLKVATVAIAGMGTASVVMAARFEAGMTKVSTLLDNFTNKELRTLSDQVLDLSTRLGVDAVKATEGLYQTLSASVKPQQSIEFLNKAAKLTIGGFGELDDITKLLAGTMNAYNQSVEDVQRISDIFIKTQKEGITTVGLMSQGFGRITSLASKMNIPLEEISAAFATITATGVDTNEAITALRTLMASIVDPSEEAAAIAERLGLDWGAAAVKAKGFVAVMKDLSQRGGENTQVLTGLGKNMRSLTAILNLAGKNQDLFNSKLKSITNSAGETQKAVAKVESSTAFRFKKMVNEIKNAAIKIGTAMLPVLNDIMDGFRDSSDGAVTLSKTIAALKFSIKVAASAWHIFATGVKNGVGGLLIGLATLSSGIHNIGASFQLLAGSIQTMFLKIAKGILFVMGKVLQGILFVIEKIVTVIAKLPVIGKKVSGALDSIRAASEGLGRGDHLTEHTAAIQLLEKEMNEAGRTLREGFETSALKERADQLFESANESAKAFHKIWAENTNEFKKQNEAQVNIKKQSEKAQVDLTRKASKLQRELWFKNHLAIKKQIMDAENFIKEVLKKRIDTIKDRLGEAFDVEKQHTARLKELQKDLLSSREGFEDKMFNITLQGLSERGKLIQQKGFAKTFETRATQAAKRGDFEEARRLATKSQELFETVAQSAKGTVKESLVDQLRQAQKEFRKARATAARTTAFNTVRELQRQIRAVDPRKTQQNAAVDSMKRVQGQIEGFIRSQQQNVQKGLNNARKNITDLRNELTNLFMRADRMLKINVDTSEASRKLTDLKKQVDELRTEAQDISKINMPGTGVPNARSNVIPTLVNNPTISKSNDSQRSFPSRTSNISNNTGNSTNSGNVVINISEKVDRSTVRNVIIPEIQIAQQRKKIGGPVS